MIMTKTPMMAPMIPRFTSPPSIRVLTAASDPVVEHQPVVAGSVQPNLAKIGDQRGSSAKFKDVCGRRCAAPQHTLGFVPWHFARRPTARLVSPDAAAG